MRTTGGASIGILLFLLGQITFGASINVGTWTLQPDTLGQQIPITITGGEPVQGVVLNVQVADGYPDVTGSSVNGPNITAIDLVGPGTLFGGVGNTGTNSIAEFPQMWIVGTSTTSGAVPADGVLAWLTIDTAGFQPGSGPWPLLLRDTFNGDTNFQTVTGQLVPAIENGWILLAGSGNDPGSFIPEPATAVLFLLSSGAIAGRLRRRFLRDR